MHPPDTQELTIRDIHTNRPLVFKQAANGEVHVHFDALSREATVDSGELLLAAQMLAAERGFDETDVRVELQNWLNGIISQDELIKRLRVHLAAIAVPTPAPPVAAPRESAAQNSQRRSDEAPLQRSDEAPLQNTLMHTVIRDIILERERQMKLLASGAIQYDCADPEVHPDRKLRAAAEELGEVANAIDVLEITLAMTGMSFANHNPSENTIKLLREQLRTECIQLAAVAAAFAESLTEDVEAFQREA